MSNSQSPSPRILIKLQPTCETVADFPRSRLSLASLAYLGDVVYELYIRSNFLLPPKRIASYHNQVVSQVRAETQAAHLRSLEPYLTDSEKEIVRRGRNAAKVKSRRTPAAIYQQASSLETLIGYLYLTNLDRLHQLLDTLNIW